jgi:hypothetical protein
MHQHTHHQHQQLEQPGLPGRLQQHSSSLSTSAQALLLPGAGCKADSNLSRRQSAPLGRCSVRAQHIPAAPAAVVNLSGAGDTLTGGLTAALVRGADPLHALAVGIAAARVSVQCKLNVPGPDQGLMFECVEQEAMKLLEEQSVWEYPVQATL